MKPARIHLTIDELVIDAALAAQPAQLQRALSREIARRISAENTPILTDAAAPISAQVTQAIRSHSQRGGNQ